MQTFLIISIVLLSSVLQLSSCEKKVAAISSAEAGNKKLAKNKEHGKMEEAGNKKAEVSSKECPVDREHYSRHKESSASHGGHYDVERMIEFFEKNPVTQRERECFAKLNPGDSIDFVIDLAPSPSMDKMDKLSAHAPIGLFLESERSGHGRLSVTRSYFDYVALFIDIVSCGMKPELTHTVIVDGEKREKFYLRGRYINGTLDSKHLGGDFSDKVRNVKTMWPASTRSYPETRMAKILVNNLGRMTKLALWNRDNGLPTVLGASRRSKPVYSIVLTDGSSGALLRDLVGDDLSRTTVIDLGNHRFIERLQREEFDRIRGGIYTLVAPQTLPAFAGSVRNMACWLGSNRGSSASAERYESLHSAEAAASLSSFTVTGASSKI